MLKDKIGKLGFEILDEVALPALWNGALEDFRRPVSILLSEIFGKRSVVYHLLALKQFDFKIFESTQFEFRDEELALEACSIARRFGHTAINEVHIIAALLSLMPERPDQHNFPIATFKRVAPIDARIDRAMEQLRVSGKGALAAKILQGIRSGRLSRHSLAAKVHAYLSSNSYPFNRAKWREYEVGAETFVALPEVAVVEDISLIAFAAHRARDIEIGR